MKKMKQRAVALLLAGLVSASGCIAPVFAEMGAAGSARTRSPISGPIQVLPDDGAGKEEGARSEAAESGVESEGVFEAVRDEILDRDGGSREGGEEESGEEKPEEKLPEQDSDKSPDQAAEAMPEKDAEEAAKEADDQMEREDFSSARLLVAAPSGKMEGKEDHILSSFRDLHLLQYDSEEEARQACLAYREQGLSAEPDQAFAVAQTGFSAGEPASMTRKENPLAELEEALDTESPDLTGCLALIDTGTSPSEDVLERVSMAGESAGDDHGHGDRMAEIIRSEWKKARILSIKAFDRTGRGDASAVYAAIQYAIEKKASCINLSFSAAGGRRSRIVADAIEAAVGAGITVIGAAGNEGMDAGTTLPGGLDSIIVAGACDASGRRLPSSNFGSSVDVNVAADSTSEAAARLSGRFMAGGSLEPDGIRIFPAFPGGEMSPGPEGDESFHVAVTPGNTVSLGKKNVLIKELDPVSRYYGDFGYGTWETGYHIIRNERTGRTVRTGMCIQPSMKNNAVGSRLSLYEWKNSRALKVLYYGHGYGHEAEGIYKVVGDSEGKAQIITHMAAARLQFMDTNDVSDWDHQANDAARRDTETYLALVDKLPVPEGVTLYLANENGNGMQMIVWLEPMEKKVEKVLRGNLHFMKLDDKGQVMAGIPFLISALDKEGRASESHVIVSDSRGVVDTARPRMKKCNLLDGLFRGRRWTGSKSELDPSVGIWFGKAGERSDSRGALLPGSYRITELACKANRGRDLIETELEVKGEENLSLNPLVNREIRLVSVLRDAKTGSKIVSASEDKVSLTDTLAYTNLTPGRTYTVRGQLIRKKTGEPVGEGAVSDHDEDKQTDGIQFRPDREEGRIDLTYSLSPKGYEGEEFVAAAALFWGDAELQSHRDLDDDSQTIGVAGLSTAASADGLDEVSVRDEEGLCRDLTILDQVAYRGLRTRSQARVWKERYAAAYKKDLPYDSRVDETYIIRGTLMDKKTRQPLVDKAGRRAEAWSEPFEAASGGEGKIQMTFTLRAGDYSEEGGRRSLLEGRSLVVFEQVYRLAGRKASEFKKNPEGSPAAVHEDFEDGDQDITFPSGGTRALDGISPDRLEGLKEDLARLWERADAEIYSAEHEIAAGPEICLVDLVRYENLHADRDYEVTGTMQIVRSFDESGRPRTWEPAVDDLGRNITGRVTFHTPGKGREERVSGYAAVPFRFPGQSLTGQTIVAFESVREKKTGRIVFVHADIEDEGQTIYSPSIKTRAYDLVTESRQGLSAGPAFILDEISYENLCEGEDYRIEGSLTDRESGREIEGSRVMGSFRAGEQDSYILPDGRTVTGKDEEVRADLQKLLSDGGDPLTVRKTEDRETKALAAAPDKPGETRGRRVNGKVCLVFPLRAEGRAGRQTVVFERLYAQGQDKTSKLVASHEDPNDPEQTVSHPELRTEATVQGKHEAAAKEKVTLTDRVSFKGLSAEKEYRLKGVLIDKATGQPVRIDGKEVEAERRFRPRAEEGQEKVTFTFDASGLAGTSLVVYETLLTTDVHGRSVEVAGHRDREDEGQTVHFREDRKPSRKPAGSTPKTGDAGPGVSAALFLLALGLLIRMRAGKRGSRKES